jgi:SAM-dependent methyltransferase
MELKLYTELADWWPLMSAPEDYVEEAAVYSGFLKEASSGPLRTVLELGSGGGNNASHMKRHFALTLVEPSAGMLAVSRRLNPECEHHLGDMRTFRMDRTFDAVFVHDAVCYMTTIDELRQAVTTAYVHLRPGGAALFCPDFTRETFVPESDHGGHEGPDRAMRYLEWSWDPDPDDTTYNVDYAFVLREGADTRVVHDRHVEGLFTRQQWLYTLHDVGFQADLKQYSHSEVERSIEVFVAVRR